MIRPFFETLRELRGGKTLDELGTKLHEAVQAVSDLGKGAELVLRVKIKPFNNQGISGAIVVEDGIELKLPTPDREATLFFATPEGNLTRQNQRQDDLPGISIAPSPAAERGAA